MTGFEIRRSPEGRHAIHVDCIDAPWIAVDDGEWMPDRLVDGWETAGTLPDLLAGRAEPFGQLPPEPGYERIALAIEQVCEAADLLVTVEQGMRRVLSQDTFPLLARTLDKAGLIDWAAFTDGDPMTASSPTGDTPVPAFWWSETLGLLQQNSTGSYFRAFSLDDIGPLPADAVRLVPESEVDFVLAENERHLAQHAADVAEIERLRAVSSSSPDDTAPGDVDFLLDESERMLAQHARDVEMLRRAARVLREVGKAALTVKPTLTKPYADDPDTSPWERFMEKPARDAYNLGVELTRAVGAASAAVPVPADGDTAPDTDDEFGVTCTYCGEPATDERPTVETDEGATHPECTDPAPVPADGDTEETR